VLGPLGLGVPDPCKQAPRLCIINQIWFFHIKRYGHKKDPKLGHAEAVPFGVGACLTPYNTHLPHMPNLIDGDQMVRVYVQKSGGKIGTS